jgi:hypothetical protein
MEAGGAFAIGVGTGVILSGVVLYAATPKIAERITSAVLDKLAHAVSLPPALFNPLRGALAAQVNVAVREAILP